MFSATHSSIQTYSISQTSTPSLSYSEYLSPSFTPYPSQTLSPSFTSYPSQTLSPSFTSYSSQSPLLTITAYPSPTQTCKISSLPEISSNILSNVSDNSFYAVITTIVILFLLNILVSIHYYTEYSNEKIRRNVFNPVHQNPYHTSMRDTFNRV